MRLHVNSRFASHLKRTFALQLILFNVGPEALILDILRHAYVAVVLIHSIISRIYDSQGSLRGCSSNTD